MSDLNKIKRAHINAKLQALTSILEEIKEQEYTTVAQVIAAIELDIKVINEVGAEHE